MSLNDQCGLFGQKETKNKQQNKQTNKQKLFILTPLCYAVEILLFIKVKIPHLCDINVLRMHQNNVFTYRKWKLKRTEVRCL